MQPLIIGIKGTVLALDQTKGEEIWRTPLKGGDFVNLTVVGEQVLATTRGEIFCLDKNGAILWHNPLKGLGHGLVTVATSLSPTLLVFVQTLIPELSAIPVPASMVCGSGAGADAGAIPDAVVPGENGFLFKTDDAGAMADLLVKILGDKALEEKLKAGAPAPWNETAAARLGSAPAP